MHEGRWIGLAWDGDLLWGSDQCTAWTMTGVNREGEVIEELDPEVDNYYGTC